MPSIEEQAKEAQALTQKIKQFRLYRETYETEKSFQDGMVQYAADLKKNILPLLTTADEKAKWGNYVKKIETLIKSFTPLSLDKIPNDVNSSQMTPDNLKQLDKQTSELRDWTNKLAVNTKFGGNISQYCAEYKKDLALFEHFQKDHKDKDGQLGTLVKKLANFAIMPVQRAPRYKILGDQINETNKDKTLLQYGDKISEMANDATRQADYKSSAVDLKYFIAKYTGDYLKHHRTSVSKKDATALQAVTQQLTSGIDGATKGSDGKLINPYAQALSIIYQAKAELPSDSPKSGINFFSKITAHRMIENLESHLKMKFEQDGGKPSAWNDLVAKVAPKTPSPGPGREQG